MNSAFLRFRLRQFGKFIREIPVIYLIILTGILLIAGIALYELTKELKGCLIAGTVLLALLSLLQLNRKDYHFIFLAEERAWIGLLLPFASLASLWFFTVFFSEMFRYSESQQILFYMERPAKSFLHRKLALNLKLFLCAIAPVCLVYMLIYPEHWWLILTFLVAISLNILLFITTKYAYYWPNSKITAGQIPIALAMLSLFLPILLPVILFFLIRNYLAACRNLKTYLHAYNP